MSSTRALLVALTLTTLATASDAAPDRPLRERPAPRRPGGDRELARGGDDMRRSVSLFFVHRVRIELGLDDEKTLRLLPIVEQAERLLHESAQRRGELAGQLQALARASDAGDDAVASLVRALDEEEARSQSEQNRLRNDMMAVLTPQQKARFVLFAHRFRGMVEDQVRAMQGDRRPGRAPAEGGEPPRQP